MEAMPDNEVKDPNDVAFDTILRDDYFDEACEIVKQNMEEMRVKRYSYNRDMMKKMNKKSKRLSREVSQMLIKRRIIGRDMVRRNDELALTKMALDVIEQGTTQWNYRTERLRILKEDIPNLHTEFDQLESDIKIKRDLNKEILRQERSFRERFLRILNEEVILPRGVVRHQNGEEPTQSEKMEVLQLTMKILLHKPTGISHSD